MRPVRVPESVILEIRRHSRESYPDECCGFLIAPTEPPHAEGARSIVAMERVPNAFEGERRRRFVIRPDELRAAERALEGTGRVVVGFYHSHPDHPARPSEFDQAHAWPWYTYLIVSVTATATPAIGAFELDAESGVFHEVPLGTTPAGEVRVTESLRARGSS